MAFVFYAFDKIFVGLLNFLRLRVPEDVLIWLLALPGGILGAMAAVFALGHKTGPGERDFRIELLKAYAVQVTLVFIALKWALVSREQVNTIVRNFASIVLSAVRELLAAVRA